MVDMLLTCCRNLYCRQIITKPQLPLFRNQNKFQDLKYGVSSVANSILEFNIDTGTRNMSSVRQHSTDLRENALEIFNKSLESVLPQAMVKKALQVEDNLLTVKDRQYSLHDNVHILGFGKAVAGMVRAAEDVLGSHVQGGIASIALGIQQEFKNMGKFDLLPTSASKVQLFEGAKNNLPDEMAHSTAMKIYEYACNLSQNDLALVLITGGGSSLLPAPLSPITIDELQLVTTLLFSHGASITQVNTMRKQLELLKGGGLAEAAAPAQVVSLILSDVIDDPLDFIASGPTAPDYSSPQECMDLFKAFDVYQQVPASVKKVLEERQTPYEEMKMKRIMKEQGDTLEDNIQRRRDCLNVQNVIVGSNKIATQAAENQASQMGYLPYVLSTSLQGESTEVGFLYSNLARFMCHSMLHKAGRDSSRLMSDELNIIKQGVPKTAVNDLRTIADKAVNTGKPICIIGSGETVVHVKGSGIGGRNQEVALSCAQGLHNDMIKDATLQSHFDIQFLSAGTDGRDGPCDATGAVVNPWTVSQSVDQGLHVQKCLDNNDTYKFFATLNSGKDQLVTGLTGTNVMDIQLLIIKPMLW